MDGTATTISFRSRFVRGAMPIIVFMGCVSCCLATTSQHEAFRNANPFSAASLSNTVKGLDAETASLDNPLAARNLINEMKKNECDWLPSVDGTHPDTYVLIHLLRWTDSSTSAKPVVQTDHWYLYRDVADKKWSQEDFTSQKRLLGVTKAYVLIVHLNAANLISAGYQPDYDLTVTKKTPANVAHLYALLQAYTGGASAGASKVAAAARAATPDAIWSGGILNIQYRPSDILIKSSFTVNQGTQPSKLANDITFDNEGLYYWDVGFAVPIRKISEIKLDTTSGTATPANVNSQNVFAILDGYFPPIDVKGSGFRAIPHPITGVAFAKQPLSKILVGGAWGPHASEVYLGAMFVKQQELSGNTSCSHPSGASLTGSSHYCAQFTIGINLSVSAIAKQLGAPK
jgi:hypothetical protein